MNELIDTTIKEVKGGYVLPDTYKLRDLGKDYVKDVGPYKHAYAGQIYANIFFTIFKEPTQNCQVMSAANFQNILAEKDEAISAVLSDVFKTTMKKLLLIDIRKEYVDSYFNGLVERGVVLEEEILFRSPYHSTSGNRMQMILIRIDRHYVPE